MMYTWGTTRSRQPVSDYINLLSLHGSEAGIELMFGGFVQYLKTIHDESYEELLLDKNLHTTVTAALDLIGNVESKARLSYDVVSKSYLSFITLYSELIDGNPKSVEEGFAGLDNVFVRLDKNAVSRLPYMSAQELNEFDRRVRRTVNGLSKVSHRQVLASAMESYDLESSSSQFHYSDDQLRKLVFNGWVERHYHEMETDDDREIQVYSSINDDVEKALWVYAEKEKIDSLYVSVISPMPSDISKMIAYFFRFINDVAERIINREGGSRKRDDIQMAENDIFLHLWQVMDKNSSIWIVPTMTFEKIQKLM